VRFPALFSKETPVPEDARADNPGVSFFTGLRMALLMLAPRAGKSLRQRLMRLIRREGLVGVARRLRGSHSG